MPEVIKKSKIITKLKEKLKDGIRIIIFDNSNIHLLDMLYDAIAKKNLSDIEIWHSLGKEFDLSNFVMISEEELKDVLDMYYLYDFSDKIMVINDVNQYGSLFNYVNTGILTKEEMIEVLLYKL